MSRSPALSSVRWAFKYGSWTPTLEEWIHASQCIQPEEKERIGRFVFQRDAKAAMSGRLLLRRAIADMMNIPYSEINLGRTEKGKPILTNSSTIPLSFNVSHQGDYAVLAADNNFVTGIDVMKVEYPRGSKSIEEFFRHMSRQFTLQEWSRIRSSSDEWNQLTAFYRNWCLKESYIKALGIGIGFNLQRIDFHIKSDLSENVITQDTEVMIDGELKTDWLFQETMIDSRHCVAVALQNVNNFAPWRPLNVPTFRELTTMELIVSSQPVMDIDLQYWENFCNKPLRP